MTDTPFGVKQFSCTSKNVKIQEASPKITAKSTEKALSSLVFNAVANMCQ